MKGARVGVLTAIAGLGLLGLTACSGDYPAPRVQIPPQQQQELPVEDGPRPTLVAAEVSSLGKVVTSQQGMTLYRFDKDSPQVSTCYDACAKQWTPLLAEGKEITFTGVPQNMVRTTKRKDGTRQITINKWPVYMYAKDSAPGDAGGQGMGGTWFAVTPEGKKAQGLATQADQPQQQQQQQPKPQRAPAGDSGSGY
ncbi:hypothetical protein KIPE111705_06445 [Kibdelosporangium persicum]|uniref:Lipoprotein with conserved Yx(FWY)xxD motif n=1 Tax=Kibdelosporangium persicum TaxID=2698649 RepID=A0ABX2F2V3_9PSEU|nr:hypothetical protein [Kibdelosporangium persicum]NRN65664.1 putative lipoprotein with conserved Yx(FWY)xxD motif [Kibdelosporangium persicum]